MAASLDWTTRKAAMTNNIALKLNDICDILSMYAMLTAALRAGIVPTRTAAIIKDAINYNPTGRVGPRCETK
jgi:hypothetical protein